MIDINPGILYKERRKERKIKKSVHNNRGEMNMNEKINKYPDTSYTVRRRAATVEVVSPPSLSLFSLSTGNSN